MLRWVLRIGIAALVVLLLPVVMAIGQEAPSLLVTGPLNEQLVEGNTYDITWSASGLRSVSVIASGDLTDYPGGGRGRFSFVIADAVPAEEGGVIWTVPFLDTTQFRLTFRGFDDSGQPVVGGDQMYLFRPDVLRKRTADGIYVDVRDPGRQRLYVLRDNQVIRAYLTSGAVSNDYYPKNTHPNRPHDHYGVFRITAKYPTWYSRLFNVDMPWAMNYLNGHFIHATNPEFYHRLGTAASHGCNRLHYQQAKELYDMTPIGTRVEIIVK